METLIRKTLPDTGAKAAGDDGGLQFIIAREGAVDLHQDVFAPGSLYAKGDTVLMSPWGHQLGQKPVASGAISRSGDEIIATPTWYDTRESVELKGMFADSAFRDTVEFSVYVKLDEWEWASDDPDDERYWGYDIAKAEIFEFSAQYKGAGIDTGVRKDALAARKALRDGATELAIAKVRLPLPAKCLVMQAKELL